MTEAANHDETREPSVRLARHPEGGRTLSEIKADAPTVRLAMTGSPPERSEAGGLMATPAVERQGAPALLVSYVYLKGFLARRDRYHYRDWVLDSGAFSAHFSGVEIKLQDYIDTCKRLRDSDRPPSEVFALDVINDWRATIRNTEEMWRQGIEAIPCYHRYSPESNLKGIARDYPKIAIGGVARTGEAEKIAFARQCFARVWPCRVHGFAFGAERPVLALPWHSVDASSWEMGPCAFGRWKTFGKMSVRGSQQNLRAEIEWYLALERRARATWAPRMRELEAARGPYLGPWPDAPGEDAGAPTVRLACAVKGRGRPAPDGLH